jgi:uncharacterized protein with HEPN domain
MLEAARLAVKFAAGRSIYAIDRNDPDLYAIFWNLTIIGEALTQLRKSDPGTAAQISESRQIIAFRNRIVHEYRQIDLDISSTILQEKLPRLIDELTALLDKTDGA